MIETYPAGLMEELDLVAPSSCHRIDFTFPSEHWKLTFDADDRSTQYQMTDAFAALSASGYQPITARQLSDTAFLVFARCSDLGFRTIAVPVPFTPATNAMLRSPRGLLLAVFGPDGVGKSSVISAVVNAISPLFEHQRMMRWRPQLVSSRIAKEPHKFRLPHSAGTHPLPLSMAKLAGAFLDFYLDHITSTRNQLCGGSLIAWDRYFHDLVVDTKRYRYEGPLWYPELLLRCLPTPHRFLGIVLDAEQETILRRKHELPVEEIQRQRNQYRRLTTKLPRTYIVKNDGEIDDSIREVLCLVINTMASWFAPMLPDLLNVDSSEIYADAA